MSSLFSASVNRWIAGQTIDSVISRCAKENKQGIHTMIDQIGEHYKGEEKIKNKLLVYETLIKEIASKKLNSDLSIKPTQLGLSIDKKTCARYLGKLLALAKKRGVFVWVDMESSRYTQDTIDLYLSFLKTYRIGIALQANLKRTKKDLGQICKAGGIIRLVKGAYKEPGKISYHSSEVTEKYRELLDYLFEHCTYFGIATHDNNIIKEVLTKKRKKNTFEFQFLLGIRPLKKKELVQQGYKVNLYVPFGEDWYLYMKRRIQEHHTDALLMLQNGFKEMLKRF